MSLRVGVLCVTYGDSQLPQVLQELAALPGLAVSVVDNSGDLGDVPPRVHVVKPGRNLGYSPGVNLALEGLPANLDAIVVINSDVIVSAQTVMQLAAVAAGQQTPLLLGPSTSDGSFGMRPIPTIRHTVYAHMFRRRPPGLDSRDGYLSGAFLIINRSALSVVLNGRCLLREDLFFMDDVELSRRARSRGVSVAEVVADGPVEHLGGVSVRRRPAVGVYFSRVSKVRYWSDLNTGGSILLSGFFGIEALAALASCWLRRERGGDGSKTDGFICVLKWLLTRNSAIDDRVLGSA